MPGGADFEMVHLIHEVHTRIRDIELQLDVLKPIAAKLIQFTEGVSAAAAGLKREPVTLAASKRGCSMKLIYRRVSFCRLLIRSHT
jgi:hypothetical protein